MGVMMMIFFTSSTHCNEKNFFVFIPVSHHHFQYYYSSLKKKKNFISISSQSNPVQSNSQPKISSSRSKKKKEEQRKTSPLPFGRTYLTYLAPILFPPIPPLPRFDSHFPSPNPYKFPCLARLLMCKVHCALCTFFCPLFPFLPSRCIGRWN